LLQVLKGSQTVNTYAWICAGLAAFDLLLLGLLYRHLRALPHLERRTLPMAGASIGGFLFHAYLFFNSTILFLQLTTCLAAFGLVLLAYRKQGKQEQARELQAAAPQEAAAAEKAEADRLRALLITPPG
jgi:hypothetical protein